jgi:hypothetical protein
MTRRLVVCCRRPCCAPASSAVWWALSRESSLRIDWTRAFRKRETVRRLFRAPAPDQSFDLNVRALLQRGYKGARLSTRTTRHRSMLDCRLHPSRVLAAQTENWAKRLPAPVYLSPASASSSYSIPPISSCSPFLFPPHLTWHPLGLKPCARRLGPLCFALSNRASSGFRHPHQDFKSSRQPRSMKSCRSPRKSAFPGLGAAASRFPGAQAKRAEKE